MKDPGEFVEGVRAHLERPEKPRAIYLRVDQVRALDHWCWLLSMSFGRQPWLVGSVLEHRRWRDVDVRIELPDDVLNALPIARLDLNMLLSEWGHRLTGLPIDCQVQGETEFAEHADRPRNPRGRHIEVDR